MANKSYKTAEYEALTRVVTADKRLRKFQYALTCVFFLLVVAGGYNIQQNIAHKIDGLVDGSVARGKARQQENVTIAREGIRYNTCLFILPIDQRTPENQQKCFKAADLPGGLTREDFSPIILNPDGSVVLTSVTPAPSSSASGSPSAASPSVSQPSSNTSSSPNPTPANNTTPANTSQPSGETTPSPQPNVIQRLINNVKGLL